MTVLAAVSSGLSLVLNSCPSYVDRSYDIDTEGAKEFYEASTPHGVIPSSVVGEPPVLEVGGNAVPLTVMRLMGSEEVTVCMALPA